MYDDVVDLRDFYASRLGQATRRILVKRMQEFWPEVAGQNVLGLGFATPYLRSFRDETARTVALMPAAQGVMNDNDRGRNRWMLSFRGQRDFGVFMTNLRPHIKSYYRDNNAAMDPIYVDANSGDFRIVGVAVGVYRRIR